MGEPRSAEWLGEPECAVGRALAVFVRRGVLVPVGEVAIEAGASWSAAYRAREVARYAPELAPGALAGLDWLWPALRETGRRQRARPLPRLVVRGGPPRVAVEHQAQQLGQLAAVEHVEHQGEALDRRPASVGLGVYPGSGGVFAALLRYMAEARPARGRAAARAA